MPLLAGADNARSDHGDPLAAPAFTMSALLGRVDERSRQIGTAVAGTATLLTGLGLVCSGQVDRIPLARNLAIAAIGLAILAAGVVLASLLLRFPRNLTSNTRAQVERWYRGQVSRAYAVVVAGALTLGAILLGAAGAAVVLTNPMASEPVLSVQVNGVGDEATLSARVAFPRAAAKAVLRVEVVGLGSKGARVPLTRSAARVGVGGTASTQLTVPKVGRYSALELSAALGKRRCLATVTQGGPTTGTTITCTAHART